MSDRWNCESTLLRGMNYVQDVVRMDDPVVTGQPAAAAAAASTKLDKRLNTAKIPGNQKYCDELRALADKCKTMPGKDNLKFTLEKARKSIMQHDAELHTKKDFLSLRGVGDYVAKILVDVQQRIGEAPPTSQPLERASSLPASFKKLTRTNSVDSNSSKRARVVNNTATEEDIVILERSHSLPNASSRPALLLRRTSSVESTGSEPEVETPCTAQNSKLVLLLDTREVGANKDRHFFETELRARGVEVEVVSLPLGDMLWVVRNTQTGKSHVCCNTIVERKTVPDLATSIKDGRYNEQRSRLVRCGLERKIYLVEGQLNAVGLQIQQSALETSLCNTRLSGFLVVHTDSRHHSCEYLVRVHQSLAKQITTFKMKPSNVYEAFSIRSRMREAETVGELFQAMLIQVPGSSAEKTKALTNMYPTMTHLMQAYEDLSTEEDKEQMVRDVTYGMQSRKLGPVFSKTLKLFFCSRQYVD